MAVTVKNASISFSTAVNWENMLIQGNLAQYNKQYADQINMYDQGQMVTEIITDTISHPLVKFLVDETEIEYRNKAISWLAKKIEDKDNIEKTLGWLEDKSVNTLIWESSKPVLKEFIEITLEKYGQNPKSLYGVAIVGIAEGIYKMNLDYIADGEVDYGVFIAGAVKSWGTNSLKIGFPLVDKVVKTLDKTKFTEFLQSSIKKIVKDPSLLGDMPLKAIYEQFPKQVMGTVLKSVGSATIVATALDYTFSLVSNIYSETYNNKEETLLHIAKEEFLSSGSTLLKSTFKGIGGIAGYLIGGKVGNVIGTAVGAFAGDFAIKAFTDEDGNADSKWCAIAAGATAVGAVAGVAVVVFLSSNPVGWVCAAGLAAGAVVGCAITAIIYNKDKIANWAVSVYNVASSYIKDSFTEILEDTAAVYNYVKDEFVESATAVYDYIRSGEILEDTAAALNYAKVEAEKFVQDPVDTICGWGSQAWNYVFG